MAYIGRGLDKISNVEKLDNLTFDGSSTSFALQKGGSSFVPSSANNILLSIDGVVQAGNFTVSGSTIDFGTAISGSSTCDFILHYGVGLITAPADGTVTTVKLQDNAVTTAKLNDGSVSLAKLTATGTKDATTFLRGDNSFAVPAGGDNTPAFRARRGSNQTVSNATATIILFDTEDYDTDSAYDTANGRFTVPSGEGGKYLITANLRFNSATSNRNALDIKINNSSAGTTASEWTSGQYGTLILTTTYVLSAGDYIDVEYYQSSGGSIEVRTESFFSAHKLIGV